MNDEEIIDHIIKYYNERECLECSLWHAAALEYGKIGMCADCFEIRFVPIEFNVENLGMPMARVWKDREDLLEMYPNG
jgi:hypothetical protein